VTQGVLDGGIAVLGWRQVFDPFWRLVELRVGDHAEGVGGPYMMVCPTSLAFRPPRATTVRRQMPQRIGCEAKDGFGTIGTASLLMIHLSDVAGSCPTS
jgi:hypothetical protein